MLNQIISRLKQTGEWPEFVKVFDIMINDIVLEMRNGQVKTLEQLSNFNGQLEVLEKCKNLDKMKFKGGA